MTQSENKERWKPQVGEWYYYVTSFDLVECGRREQYVGNGNPYRCGNCYKTREEAEAAAKRVRRAYSGDDWLTEKAATAGDLTEWYILSVSASDTPVWTDEHIEELLKDYIVISKGEFEE